MLVIGRPFTRVYILRLEEFSLYGRVPNLCAHIHAREQFLVASRAQVNHENRWAAVVIDPISVIFIGTVEL